MKYLIELDELNTKTIMRIAECTSNKELIKDFSENKKWQIRRALTENPNLSNEIIYKLMHDKIFKVRDAMFDVYNQRHSENSTD